MGWGSIYIRRLTVFTLAFIVYLDYKVVDTWVEWFSKAKKDELLEKTHARNARRIFRAIVGFEGLWVKLGQYMSTRADVFPEAYTSVLKQLQDSLPPRPLSEVRRSIEKELGKSMTDLFSSFVDTPLATASIAQVHRATLKDGQEVVVKVQHEGIKEIILEDLKNAKSIVDWIAWAEPECDLSPLIDEWCREAPKELDFNHEAENTRKVSRNLRCKCELDRTNHANCVDVLIPEVIQSSERVLILQYMDGIRLNDNELLETFGIDKHKLVEEITRAYAHQIYIDGFFNGDPHPGNLLVSKEAPHRPILLDFGLTKAVSSSMKQALAKMFLACAEGNHVALLSAFAEMGLKLNIDMPEKVMKVSTYFFRTSRPASEELELAKSYDERRKKNMKAGKKETEDFNPVNAFPGDAVIFMRVLELLRGLSSTMNVRIAYLGIMKPFAESTLEGSVTRGPDMDKQWIYDSPVHSEVEAKLRQLLIELGSDRILGIQVCAYKDGHVIIDTAAGSLGRYDPRPVQPDSLFPVFSVTKGITAGMVHWLVDKGKLKLDDTIGDIWPEFRTNNKYMIKVHHILNHTTGLHNAIGDVMVENPLLMCNWEESLQHIGKSTPETEPGSQQLYHYLSFGWLCGGIIERASGKKFQEILEEAIVHPLNIEGELYIGIPPGVESRLASLTLDTADLEKLSQMSSNPEFPQSLQGGNLAEVISGLTMLFNTLNVRRAIIPAANCHCSARALARYYATLVTGGVIPPPHTSLSKPLLGSHIHIPELPPRKTDNKKSSSKDSKKGIPQDNNDSVRYRLLDNNATNETMSIFQNPRIHDAFMGMGDHRNLVIPGGKFGLGFRRFETATGQVTSFGHSGAGGSTGFCDIEHNFAIAVTLNKMSLGGATARIIQLVCSELNVPLPEEFSPTGEKGPDMTLGIN